MLRGLVLLAKRVTEYLVRDAYSDFLCREWGLLRSGGGRDMCVDGATRGGQSLGVGQSTIRAANLIVLTTNSYRP